MYLVLGRFLPIYCVFNAVFNWVSKVIRNYFGFALLSSVIGLKNSRHLLNQSDANPKPIATWSHAFSRALRHLRVFASSSHWFVLLFRLWLAILLLWFWFLFTILNWKPVYVFGITLQVVRYTVRITLLHLPTEHLKCWHLVFLCGMTSRRQEWLSRLVFWKVDQCWSSSGSEVVFESWQA